MNTLLLPFFIVLLAAFLFSELFRRLHLPSVIALIVSGMLIGPYGFNIFVPNETINFFGDMGLIFLMFMAGLEIKLTGLKDVAHEVGVLSILNALLTFTAGFGIGLLFNLPLVSSLILGIIFISSSVAIVIPFLESRDLLSTDVGKVIIGKAVTEDIFSLILLSLLLKFISPTTTLPIFLFYILFFGTLVFVRWFLPNLRKFLKIINKQKNLFHEELIVIFVTLLGVVLFFEYIGVHSIVAGFFTGLMLSDVIKTKDVLNNLKAISYGIFIPIFFVLIGVNTNVLVLVQVQSTILLTLAILFGSIGTKVLSGFIGSRLSGFSNKQAIGIAVSTIPQLSTTLAVVSLSAKLGLLSDRVVTSLILLSIVTVFVTPFLMSKTIAHRKTPNK